MKAVIDSDVLIDYLQGNPKAKREIDRYKTPLYSIVSWMEVMCGAETEEERESAEALFRSMKRVDLSQEIAGKAVEERKTLGLKLPDAIILATADSEGCILVTRNTKDFRNGDPRVRIPLQPVMRDKVSPAARITPRAPLRSHQSQRHFAGVRMLEAGSV